MSAQAKIDTYNLRSRTIDKFGIRPLSPGLRRRSMRRRSSRRTTKRCYTSGGRTKPVRSRQNSKKPKPPGNRKKMGGRCPPPVKVDEKDYLEQCYMEQCQEAAEPALEYYNSKIAPSDGGTTYEMVDLGMSTAFGIPMQQGYKLHSNFIAKPHNSVDGPHMLFFAEVWKAIYPDETCAVLKCQRLGPEGHVFTGHNGCRACGPESDDPIHHPLDGGFDVGSAPCLLSSTSV